MASTYRYYDMGTPTLRTKFTYSVWVKRSGLGAIGTIASMWADGNNHVVLRFNSDDTLVFYDYSSSSMITEVKTNAVFRDTFAWYHIVVAFDSTQGTAADRTKLYVNGVQQTSLATATYGAQNNTPSSNVSGTDHYLGARGDGANYDGLMSHAHFIDGLAYPASTFGSTDSTTGSWKINTGPSVTYGTNGFFMFKDNASLNDQSGNSNNFTAQSGTLTKTEDNPSNVFCTISPLDNMNASNTSIPGKLENGNLSFINNDSNQIYTRGSIGVKSGKWYWEAKQGSGTAWAIGICVEAMLTQTNNQFWDTTTVTGVAANGSGNTLYINGGSGDSWNTSISVGASSIYGFALDVDNRAFYIHHNGTYLTANGNVGNPTSGGSRTGSVLGQLTTRGGTGGLNYIPVGEYIYPFMGDLSTSNSTNLQMNFGNGFFATTAISSEGTNASGLGKFEYDVPAGYTALCTKGLNL